MSKPTVILDCDGVLYDFAGAVCEKYNVPVPQHFSDFGGVDLNAAYDDYDFCASVQPYAGAMQFVDDLRSFCRPQLATHATPHAVWQHVRVSATEEHFGTRPCFTNTKWQIHGDVLVDDSSVNILGAVQFSAKRLVFVERPWSRPDRTRWPLSHSQITTLSAPGLGSPDYNRLIAIIRQLLQERQP